MISRSFTLPVFASLLLHVAGLVFAARLVELSSEAPAITSIPIEVVTAEPTPSVPLLQQKPPASQRITPPRLIEKPSPSHAVQSSAEPPPLPNELLSGSLSSSSAAKEEEPLPEPVIPLPATKPEYSPGNVIGPATTAGRQAIPSSTSAEGGEAGAGRLFANGDMAVLPGAGAGGGSGGPGANGLGLGVTDTGAKVTGLRLGFARPRGGYQITPRYPESARRQGIEGIALLRFQVLTNGRVGEVLIERSAGHYDLDLAAVEAIRRWRFEPARRGHQAIAAWAMLPVEFRLKK